MILTKLTSYQKWDTKFLAKHPRSANFNDCGLGKTLEELVVMHSVWHKHPRLKVLVFCPKSCIQQWIDQIMEHTDCDVRDIASAVYGDKEQKKRALKREALVYITNYETALTNFDDIISANPQFEYIVCDESTRIKNPNAKTTKAVIAIADRAKYVRIMTGLPTPQTPLEIFSQYRVMDSGETFGKSFNLFKRKYFNSKGVWPTKKWYLKSEMREEFAKKIQSKCVRNLRSKVLELPPVTVVRRIVDWDSTKTRTAYNMLERSICNNIYVESAGILENMSLRLVKLNKLSQFTSGVMYGNRQNNRTSSIFRDNPKLSELERILHDYNVAENKIVVTGYYSIELDLVYNYLRKKLPWTKPVLITGAVAEEDKDRRRKSFLHDSKVRVLVANERTIAYGLNLQVANIIVFYSLQFSVEMYKQLCDRIHRFGQDKNCLLIHLLIENTYDEQRFKIVTSNLDEAQVLMRFVADRGK